MMNVNHRKISCICILIFIILCMDNNVALAIGKLFPCDMLYSRNALLSYYHKELELLFISELTNANSIVFMMIEMPFVKPERAVLVYKSKDDSYIVYSNELSANLWNLFNSDTSKEDMKRLLGRAHYSAISSDIVLSIRSALDRMLDDMTTIDHEDDGFTYLDGTLFQFSSIHKGCGLTLGTPYSAKPGRLVEIGETLFRYSRADDPQSKSAMEKELRQKTKKLCVNGDIVQ
jgi:hypothetical protein